MAPPSTSRTAGENSASRIQVRARRSRAAASPGTSSPRSANTRRPRSAHARSDDAAPRLGVAASQDKRAVGIRGELLRDARRSIAVHRPQIAGGVDRAQERVKRVVQVDEPQQVMQRALGDDEPRLRQRAVASRIEIDQPPVAQRRRRQQRAPVRRVENAAGQREARPRCRRSADAMRRTTTRRPRPVRRQRRATAGWPRKARGQTPSARCAASRRRARTAAASPASPPARRFQACANGRNVVTQCVARRVDGLWTVRCGVMRSPSPSANRTCRRPSQQALRAVDAHVDQVVAQHDVRDGKRDTRCRRGARR